MNPHPAWNQAVTKLAKEAKVTRLARFELMPADEPDADEADAKTPAYTPAYTTHSDRGDTLSACPSSRRRHLRCRLRVSSTSPCQTRAVSRCRIKRYQRGFERLYKYDIARYGRASPIAAGRRRPHRPTR